MQPETILAEEPVAPVARLTPEPPVAAPWSVNPYLYLGQIAETYLLLRDSSGNLAILDQHAAHERILYEKLSQNAASESQRLMVPLALAIDPAWHERLSGLLPRLGQFGFRLREEDGTLIADAIPALLTRQESREFLQEALSDRRDGPDELLISMACHGAIKAGQKLGADEAYELVRQWSQCRQADFCPHGRPCILRWDAASLERMFKRR